jgi:hypothetical protein
MLEWQYYEQCNNKGAIFGYAFDAETGNPLVGAKVSAKQGTTIVANDYVPYFGELTYFVDDSLYGSFYGLFNVLTPAGDQTITIAKTKYMTITPKDEGGVPELITVDPCFWSYAGNIPVPPAKPLYWLVVTWDPGFTDTYFDSYLDVVYPDTSWERFGYGYRGDLKLPPYVKYLWDSDDGMGDLRDYSESIRILKTLTGTSYYFWVEDYWSGSLDFWNTSGIKAYVFKGNTLLKTYTPPPGSVGYYWDICEIEGTTITPINEVWSP